MVTPLRHSPDSPSNEPLPLRTAIAGPTAVERQLTAWLIQIHVMKIFATDRGKKLGPDLAAAISEAEHATETFLRSQEQAHHGRLESDLAEDGLRLRRTAAFQTSLRAHGMLCDVVKPATPSSIPFSVSEEAPHRSMRRRFLFWNFALAGLSVVLLAFPYLISYLPAAADASAANSAGSGVFSSIATMLSIVGAGGIGASFFNLYLIREYLTSGSFDPIFMKTYYTRFVLGTLGGLLLAVVVENMYSSSTSTSPFTPTVVALIGGFAIEVVNDIMLRLTETLRTLVQGRGDQIVKAEREAMDAQIRHAQFQGRIQQARDLAQLLAEAKAAGASPELLKQIQSLVDATLGTTPSKP